MPVSAGSLAACSLLLRCSGVCGDLPGALAGRDALALGFNRGCTSCEFPPEFLPPCGCTLRATYNTGVWYCLLPDARWGITLLTLGAASIIYSVLALMNHNNLLSITDERWAVFAATAANCGLPRCAAALQRRVHAQRGINKFLSGVIADARLEADAAATKASALAPADAAQLLMSHTEERTDPVFAFTVATPSSWAAGAVGLARVALRRAASGTAADWRAEVVRMRQLGVAHPHIAQLLCVSDACAQSGGGAAIALLWGARPGGAPVIGTLATSLEKQPLSLRHMLRLAKEAATGLAYLHLPEVGLVHGRLRAATTLLCTAPSGEVSPSVRLAAFGHAGRGCGNDGEDDDDAQVSWAWRAPERLAAPRAAPTQAGDQYALGVLLWEIFHRSGRPFPDVPDDAPDRQDAVINGRRPRVKAALPMEVRALMAGCWASDLQRRFTAARVACTLARLEAAEVGRASLDARLPDPDRRAEDGNGGDNDVDDDDDDDDDDDGVVALEFPRHGISLAALRAFVDELRGATIPPSEYELADWRAAARPGSVAPQPAPALFESLTTTQVVQRIIKPLTASTGGSYADLLLAAGARDAASGAPLAADATVFVSHAWGNNFCSLAAAVLAALDGKHDSGRVYMWNDIFVGPQHKADNLPQSWWTRTFAAAIATIGRTLLVADPYSAPAPLTRSWCLWELHCTLDGADWGDDGAGSSDSGITDSALAWSGLEVALPPAQVRAFHKDLARDLEGVRSAIEQIDARRARAFKPTDEAHIHSVIGASPGGFVLVNTRIRERLAGWLLRAANAALRAGLRDELAAGTAAAAVSYVTPTRLVKQAERLARWHTQQGEEAAARRAGELALQVLALPRVRALLAEPLPVAGGSRDAWVVFRLYRAHVLRGLTRVAEAIDEFRTLCTALLRCPDYGPGHAITRKVIADWAATSKNELLSSCIAMHLLHLMELRGNPTAPLARRVLRPLHARLARTATGRLHGCVDALFFVLCSFPYAFVGWSLLLYLQVIEVPAAQRLCAAARQRSIGGASAGALAPAQAEAAEAPAAPAAAEGAGDADAAALAGVAAFNSATALREQGRHAEALRELRTTWAALAPRVSSAHYEVAICAALQLGDMCSALGRRASLLRRFGFHRPFRPLLRDAAARQAHLAEAEAVLRPALHACRNLLGATHPRSVECAFSLAVALQRRALTGGDDASECALEAAALVFGAADSLDAALGADHPRARAARVRAHRLEHLHAEETVLSALHLPFFLWAAMALAAVGIFFVVVTSKIPGRPTAGGGSGPGDPLLMRLERLRPLRAPCGEP
jgi:hypothetical protein